MSLQVKRAGADEASSYLKVIMAGEPGAGKTRIASTFPNVLYAECEDGLRSVVDRNPAYVSVRSSADLNELRVNLQMPSEKREANFGCPVDTVCIDTLDEMQRILIRERLDEQHKETLAIGDYGWLGDQVRGIVRAFRNLDLNVIFNVHLKSDRDEETGRTFIKAQLVGAMADELPAYVDMALLLKVTQTTKVIDGQSRRVEQRLMQTSGDINHTWIRDRTGKLPKPEFEVDLNTDYARIVAWIAAGDTIAPSANLGVLASAPPREVVAAPKGPAKVTTAAKKAAGIKPEAVPIKVVSPPSPPPVAKPEPVLPPATTQEVAAPEELPSSVPEPAEQTLSLPEAQPEPEADVANDLCSVCGIEITEDERDFSLLRFREQLCHAHLVEKKKVARR